MGSRCRGARIKVQKARARAGQTPRRFSFWPNVPTEQLGHTVLCLSGTGLAQGYNELSLGLTLNAVPAVLAAGAPEQTAFMSDEAMESVPGLKPIQYTAKHYDLFLGKMTEKKEKLNKGDMTLADLCVFASIIIVA